MKALSKYQNAILTEIGIGQWQLRHDCRDEYTLTEEGSSGSVAGAVGVISASAQFETQADDELHSSAQQGSEKIVEAAGVDVVSEPAPNEQEIIQSPEQNIQIEAEPVVEPLNMQQQVVLMMAENSRSQPLILDVLSALSLSDIEYQFVEQSQTVSNYQLLWREDPSVLSVRFEGTQLVTPPVLKLEMSGELKAQLWRAISEHADSKE